MVPICQEVVTGHQRSPPPSIPTFHCALWPRCLCSPVLCACARTAWMFSSLRACHSSSIVGKQQDGAMESSQTKGNACPVLRVGWRRVWHRVGGRPPQLQEQHPESR